MTEETRRQMAMTPGERVRAWWEGPEGMDVEIEVQTARIMHMRNLNAALEPALAANDVQQVIVLATKIVKLLHEIQEWEKGGSIFVKS